MQHHIDNKIFHIEVLTPKQNSQKLDVDLETFADADDPEPEDFWPAHPAPQRHAIDMEALG